MAAAEQAPKKRPDPDSISNLSGDTFLLGSDDESELSQVRETNRRKFYPSLPGETSYASKTAERVEENVSANASNVFRRDRFLSAVEREHFHRDNVTPARPCTAFFNSGTFVDSKDVFEALHKVEIPAESLRCLQRKPNGDMLITFANTQHKELFLRNNAITLHNRNYAVNDNDVSLAYLNIYDAPHELPDNALIKRLEPFCEVLHIRRGRLQTNKNIFNGNRHYRVRIITDVPSYLRFGKFLVRLSHDGQQHTCRRCNRIGHFANECDNVFCFNCEGLGHVARECPRVELCCICKEPGHRGRFCKFSWHRENASPRQSPPQDVHPSPPSEVPSSASPPPSTSPLLVMASDGFVRMVPPPGDGVFANKSVDDGANNDSVMDMSDGAVTGAVDDQHVDGDDDDDHADNGDGDANVDDDDDDDDDSDDTDGHDDDDDDDNDVVNDDDNDNEDDIGDSASAVGDWFDAKDDDDDLSAAAAVFEDLVCSPESQPSQSPEKTPTESQSLFSTLESPPPLQSAESSGFGPIRPPKRFARRTPAPMPEALAAIHRRATMPAPVPSGRRGRGDGVGWDPPVPSSVPPSDPGNPGGTT